MAVYYKENDVYVRGKVASNSNSGFLKVVKMKRENREVGLKKKKGNNESVCTANRMRWVEEKDAKGARCLVDVRASDMVEVIGIYISQKF